MFNTPHMTDVATLRSRAREHIERGAVTSGYQGNSEVVVRLLNDALATELICVLRYKHHHFMASGLNSESVALEFAEHAKEEMLHADALAKRIVQLGGVPDMTPDTLSQRSHAEYVVGGSLLEMIQENLVAERIAIDSYRETIAYLGSNDPTTRRMLEEILATEEEHADELAGMLGNLAPVARIRAVGRPV
ncbi:bacterioferritin [Chitinimonas arctica]|uniref:Bacterioferritin n=1 Tax=Chitinimonas arctica TaxID=2594795 RepID=A0A516SHC8_9NEIS|nr:ferritin-like domain-containing protein [Chitinimonas arctica]QDQ27545.1 bacterioferritin [Chitinimonas arctica]